MVYLYSLAGHVRILRVRVGGARKGKGAGRGKNRVHASIMGQGVLWVILKK